MRVISGKYKGKRINGYDIDGTRPTMDRVKESMFGTIQDYIKDSVVLDLFAGSGNLGIEALSNGALKGYFVDNNKKVIDTIKKNIDENFIGFWCLASRNAILSKTNNTSYKWVWNNLSTLTSQMIDTAIFIIIGFGFGMKWLFIPQMLPILGYMIIGQYIFKAILAILDTPFFYWFTRERK